MTTPIEAAKPTTPFKITEPGYYRTRDGRKAWATVCPIGELPQPAIGAIEGRGGECWCEDGRWMDDCHERCLDLVAPWTDPAHATAVFSPGDIAECIQQCGGGIAKVGERFTVSSVRKDSGFGGEWLCFKETGSAAFESTRFKKVEPSPEATAGMADGVEDGGEPVRVNDGGSHESGELQHDGSMWRDSFCRTERDRKAWHLVSVGIPPDEAFARVDSYLALASKLTEAARREKEPT